jgi:protein-disulfide isomerase
MPHQSSKSTKQPQNRVQKLTIITGVVVILIVVSVIVYQQWSANNPPGSVSGESSGSDPFRLEKQPSLGSSEAKVKVVEFGDYKCPACKRFSDEIFPRIREEFIDTGKIEFYFINFQFIAPDSVTAGIAGECVYRQSEAAFWQFHEALYTNQGEESQRWATPSTLLRLAREHAPGLDYAALETCISKTQYEADVKEDEKLGSRAGVTGTPSIFVNGKIVQRWTYDGLKAAIERELEK